MNFKTCSCTKENVICIKTGFMFIYNGKRRGGDLFLCKTHGALAIHGVPKGTMEPHSGESIFTGLLVSQDENYGESEAGGVVDLSATDLTYIERHNDIRRYAFVPGVKKPFINELTTTINGEEVEIGFYYDRGDQGSYYQPPEPPSVEIDYILYKGVDVQYILSEQVLDELAEECLDDIHEGLDEALNAAAEAEYDRMKEEGF
jgi:hypothetical protein